MERHPPHVRDGLRPARICGTVGEGVPDPRQPIGAPDGAGDAMGW